MNKEKDLEKEKNIKQMNTIEEQEETFIDPFSNYGCELNDRLKNRIVLDIEKDK